MDYEVAKQKYVSPDETSVNPNVAFNYGPMPYDMLLQKFEETDLGPDEDAYDNFARTTLSDWRPDAPTTAADEPRGRVNSSAGMLQNRYYGHRGDADMPNHSEIFQDFVGSEWADPRGYAIDPDSKEIVKQGAARMRFVRFTPDNCEQITGGRLSENQEIELRQDTFRRSRDLLKVFDYQMDGRREGMRKGWKHVGAINTTDGMNRRDDIVPAETFTPRGYNIVIDSIIRDTRAFRESTTDQCFEVQKYTGNGRARRRHGDTHVGTLVEGDPKFGAEGNAVAYRATQAVGALMAGIVALNNQAQDMNYGASTDSVARRREKFISDISLILKEQNAEADWGRANGGRTVKTAAPGAESVSGWESCPNHLLPISHYVTATKMYKSVREGNPAEMRRAIGEGLRDGKAAAPEKGWTAGMNARPKLGPAPAAAPTNVDIVDATTMTHNYRNGRPGMLPRGAISGEGFAAESDLTLFGRNAGRAEPIAPDAIIDGSQFGVNDKAERHGAPMGKKSRARRHADSDAAPDDING